MGKQSRRKFSADFKAKVVIEALKERITNSGAGKEIRASSELDHFVEQGVSPRNGAK